jgi:hypothetical protein
VPALTGAADAAELGAGTAGAERASGLLDKKEGICDPRGGRGCLRWPEGKYLLNEQTGELVPGRCKATNLCRYCQALYVMETVEMLTLDAAEWAPTIWAVLTARNHLTRVECYDHLRQVRKALKRRWPNVEWFVQVEFQRRGALHLNLLFKGVPIDQADELGAELARVWCGRPGVDALPVGQWCEPIANELGAVRYIAKMLAHGLKQEQAPPLGWRGHRTSQTRGYLVRPASVMREEARRSVALQRLAWRDGLDGDAAELELAARAEHTWRLTYLDPSRVELGNELGQGITEAERGELLAAVHEADAIERLAQRCREVLADDFWRGRG